MGGRKPNSPNKKTAAVKDALELAFDGLGGVKALQKWGKDNPSSFYALWIKMLPAQTQLSGHDGGPLHLSPDERRARVFEILEEIKAND